MVLTEQEINSDFGIQKSKKGKHIHLPLSIFMLFPRHLLLTTLGGR